MWNPNRSASRSALSGMNPLSRDSFCAACAWLLQCRRSGSGKSSNTSSPPFAPELENTGCAAMAARPPEPARAPPRPPSAPLPSGPSPQR